MKLCAQCGTMTDPRRVTKGSFWMEAALWLLFLLPGLIYSIWRLSSRHDACAACGSRDLIPADSPRAQAILADLAAKGITPKTAPTPGDNLSWG